jgi:hypothetical protein
MGTPGHTSATTALLAIAGAFVTGIVLAKCIDWIGHGYPKQ